MYRPPFDQLGLTCEKIKRLNWFGWILFISLISGITFLLIYHCYFYAIVSFLKLLYYVVLLLLIGGFIIIKTFLSPDKHLHIHHYFLMMIILPFLGLHINLDLVLFGVLSGIMIEGGCRWGLDPVWEDGWDDEHAIVLRDYNCSGDFLKQF